jgi:hypothetical protein
MIVVSIDAASAGLTFFRTNSPTRAKPRAQDGRSGASQQRDERGAVSAITTTLPTAIAGSVD